MSCGTKVDRDSWDTVRGGEWSNYRIDVGGTFFWFCVKPDPLDPHGNIWKFEEEDSGNPPDNACRIDEDDWNAIKEADCNEDEGFLQYDTNCWCVYEQTVSSVDYARLDPITCP